MTTPARTMSVLSWSATWRGPPGSGLGRAMLRHLVEVARECGMCRLRLETGSMEAFAPARSLYAGAEFQPCEPFGDYRPSCNSEFMTLGLRAADQFGT